MEQGICGMGAPRDHGGGSEGSGNGRKDRIDVAPSGGDTGDKHVRSTSAADVEHATAASVSAFQAWRHSSLSQRSRAEGRKAWATIGESSVLMAR